MTTTKLAVTTLLAVFALMFAFKTTNIGATGGQDSSSAASSAPTPYSADHARIPDSPAQEPASTF